MTVLNPNSLQAFLLKKKALATTSQPPVADQPAPESPPTPVEQVSEQTVVVEESEVVAQGESRLLSTPKPVKVANVLNREVLRAQASQLTLEDVSKLTGDERAPGVSESDFIQVLDILDQKMKNDKGIVDDFNLADFRSIISRIMIDLKANPSYAGLMLDNHVHAIMSFMWSTQAKAVENNIKKEGAAKKKVAAVGKKSALALAFNKVAASDLSL